MKLLTLSLVVCACTAEQPRPTVFGGDRPVTLGVPSQLDDSRRYPLVLVLHGYGTTGFVQQAYFGAGALRERGEAFVLAPDGTTDDSGMQFWNADSECCSQLSSAPAPDDLGYLTKLVEDVAASWPIDDRAVFAFGHSNGAFMSYRLACDRADTFAAVIALAGRATVDPCTPARPISVLHMIGDVDGLYSYTEPTLTEWGGHNGCGSGRLAGDKLDLDGAVAGAETETSTTAGCPAGGAVDFWRIVGGGHVPSPTAAFQPAYWSWLLDHRR